MVGRLVLAQEIEVRPLAPQLTTYGGIVSLYNPGNPGASRRFAPLGQFSGQIHPGAVQAIQAILAGLMQHHAPGPEQPHPDAAPSGQRIGFFGPHGGGITTLPGPGGLPEPTHLPPGFHLPPGAMPGDVVPAPQHGGLEEAQAMAAHKQALLNMLMQRRAQGGMGNRPGPFVPNPNFNY